MGSTFDVEEKMPGLRFYGVVAEVRANRVGTKTGTIKMSCEIHDTELWDMAVEKFEEFKVFSSTTEEMFSALGQELDATDNELQEAKAREQAALDLVAEKEARIAELEGILAEIGVDLGISQ